MKIVKTAPSLFLFITMFFCSNMFSSDSVSMKKQSLHDLEMEYAINCFVNNNHVLYKLSRVTFSNTGEEKVSIKRNEILPDSLSIEEFVTYTDEHLKWHNPAFIGLGGFGSLMILMGLGTDIDRDGMITLVTSGGFLVICSGIILSAKSKLENAIEKIKSNMLPEEITIQPNETISYTEVIRERIYVIYR